MTLFLTGSIIAATVAIHLLASRRGLRREQLCLLILDLAVFVTVVVATDAHRWAAWSREDGWLEWATVFAYLAAWGLFAWRAWRERGRRRLVALFLAAFCLVVAAEELSWGQRLLGYLPPEAFLAHNFQLEANLHNLLSRDDSTGIGVESRHLLALVGIVQAGLVLLARLRPDGITKDLAPPAVLAHAYLLVAAVGLSVPLVFVSEAAEWVLGLTFLLDALIRDAGSRRPTPWAAVLIPLSILCGVASAPTLDGLMRDAQADPARRSMALDELEAIAARLPGAVRSPLLQQQRVQRRLYSATRMGLLTLQAVDATPRHRYFLDPWNSAYWLLWDDAGEAVVLYSHGPNRRRDGHVDVQSGPAGDDIQVVVRAAVYDEARAPFVRGRQADARGVEVMGRPKRDP